MMVTYQDKWSATGQRNPKTFGHMDGAEDNARVYAQMRVRDFLKNYESEPEFRQYILEALAPHVSGQMQSERDRKREQVMHDAEAILEQERLEQERGLI